jgi:hypothetical protein
VFEEFLGIPMHPLLVHASVVLIPLQVLAALVYALVPFARRHIAWLVITLAVVGPLTALLSKLSGDAFRDRLIRNGTAGGDLIPKIDEHSSFGDATLYASLALSVVTVLLVVIQVARFRRAGAGGASGGEGSSTGQFVTALVLTVLVLAAAGATGYYVFRTGDTGAHMVWTGL